MALIVAALFGAGSYLIMQRALTRVIIGLGLITHGGNVLLLMAGGYEGSGPFLEADHQHRTIADPLPQAFALTAIVIAFAVTAFLLALAYRSYAFTHDDLVQDDVEDRRIGHDHTQEAEEE
ncbi:MAG: sodium:proton antiporter [Micrococcales bacterium]|nr:MAG: sodium:proton antiporter [Micrococcales bacterium]PIE27743.1 MAG: sodium:proton antiporter [Micrococcales bacterium]